MRTLLLFTFLIPCYLFGQTICSEESQHRLDSVLHALSQTDYSQKPINEVLVEIGKGFINTHYVEKTLEVPGDEPLVINLMGLDCTTYLETIVTLARLAKKQQFAFEDYQQELEYLRYRDGKKDHYPSRLHYFSDWIFENQKKDILKDITQSIGSEIYENHPSFMSSNPKYYPQLSDNDYVAQIKETELEIKERTYYFLPKESVAEHEKSIKSGDLIAITIDMNNLDISHVGLAIEQNGRIHLMHASSVSKKVEISKVPLSDYLISNKKQSGIMVCRLIDPR
jgi:hypothetical protein